MKILFFAPHAEIWVHAFPEALIAESLAQHGHEIVYVTCDRQFAEYCIPMSAASLRFGSSDVEKKKICASCQKTARLITSKFGFRGRTLGTALNERDREEIANTVAIATPDNFLEIRVDGVDVGRFALYELLLNHKKQSLQFSSAEWAEYLVQLKNSLVSLFACRRILDEERPERLVVYNSLYAVNNVACHLAERRGVPAYFLHTGGNLSRRLETMLLGRGDGIKFYGELMSFWHRIEDIPCSEKLLRPVTDHFLELLRGRNVFAYSAPKSAEVADLRQRFGIPPGRRVLVATMSSPDERFGAETIGVLQAARPSNFGSQVEWINALCHWISCRADLFLIVRVHPREFQNKREGVTSEHATSLSKSLSQMPSNVKVNWPSEQISLYDLADIADVFLNAWSAAGKEMTLLGLPVVAYASELLVYPPNLNYTAATCDGYFSKIDEALDDGWSIERTRATYRWCALEYERTVIDLRESFPNNVANTLRMDRRIIHKILNRIDPHILRKLDCERRAPTLKAKERIASIIETRSDSLPDERFCRNESVSVEEETRALRSEMRRLIRGLYGTSIGLRSSRLYDQLSAFAYADAA